MLSIVNIHDFTLAIDSTNHVKAALINSFASCDTLSGSAGSVGVDPILSMATAGSR